MPPEATYAAAGIVTYLIGAIPFGFVIIRVCKGVDIRERGSGNIGATNAGREFGWHYFAVIFALDAAKGFLPAFFLAPWVADIAPCPICFRTALPSWLALCAFVGHVFPVYLGFKGGKGVATGLGVSAALNWQATAVALGVFLLLLAVFRYVSVSSMSAAVALLVTNFFLPSRPLWPDEMPTIVFFSCAMILVLIKHRQNVRRLFAGTEPKVFSKT